MKTSAGITILTFCMLFLGCQRNTGSMEKIQFELEKLDENGLQGPADGKRALAYEFCIPDKEATRNEVQKIDPSLELMPGARGRIGCEGGEVLCVGSTHQPEFRRILSELAALDYVDRIQEAFFE